MIGFLIGLVVGGTAGVLAMCLCVAAGQVDKSKNCTGSNE